MGRWMMHTPQMESLYDLIMSENITFEPETVDMEARTQSERDAESDAGISQLTAGGVLIVELEGTMMRGESSFGGASTVQIRRILRNAATDSKVKAVLIEADTPGGTVAGTDELAQEIRNFSAIKPIHTHVGNLLASAGCWACFQTDRVTATRMSEIGSLGTVAVVHDMSGAAEKEGIKVHVVSTGPHKGAFTPGSEVTPEQLADLQATVDKFNTFFKAAVSEGRGMPMDAVDKLFDGRVHIAGDALKLGLIDGIGSIEGAVAELEAMVDTSAADNEAEQIALATRRRR